MQRVAHGARADPFAVPDTRRPNRPAIWIRRRGTSFSNCSAASHANKNTATVLATHSHEAAALADRVVRMRDGKIEEILER